MGFKRQKCLNSFDYPILSPSPSFPLVLVPIQTPESPISAVHTYMIRHKITLASSRYDFLHRLSFSTYCTSYCFYLRPSCIPSHSSLLPDLRFIRLRNTHMYNPHPPYTHCQIRRLTRIYPPAPTYQYSHLATTYVYKIKQSRTSRSKMCQPTNRSLRLPQPFSFWFQYNLSLKPALILRTSLADLLHPGHNQFVAFLLQLTMSLVLCPSYYAASCPHLSLLCHFRFYRLWSSSYISYLSLLILKSYFNGCISLWF
jgi:hypothetical protein